MIICGSLWLFSNKSEAFEDKWWALWLDGVIDKNLSSYYKQPEDWTKYIRLSYIGIEVVYNCDFREKGNEQSESYDNLIFLAGGTFCSLAQREDVYCSLASAR